jgi:hypothetical protein
MKRQTFLAVVMVFCMGLGAAHAQNLARGVVTNVGDAWQTVNLPRSYTNMVVVCTASYASTMTTRACVRMRNASGNSFQLHMVHPAVPPLPLSGYPVHYMVVEAGQYTQAANGVKMEAVKYTSTQTAYKTAWTLVDTRTYLNSYTNPVVLGQVMTSNDANWSVFYESSSTAANPPTATSLLIGKHVGEDTLHTRANEDIGYIVIEAGSGTMSGANYVAAVSPDAVQGMTNVGLTPYTITFTGLATVEVAIVTQAAAGGADGGWAVLCGYPPLRPNPVRVNAIDVGIAEDDILDLESDHSAEPVSYIVFEVPPAGPPTAPSNLTAQSVNNRVLLGWADNSTNETAFKLERRTPTTTYAEITQPGANSTSYLDTGVTVGQTYTYRIRATNSGGDSAYSNEVTVTVTATLAARHWHLYEQ